MFHPALSVQITLQIDPVEAGGLSFQRPGEHPSRVYGTGIQRAPRISLDSELNDANRVLEGLCFSPSHNFHGTVLLFVGVSDDGASGQGGALSANATVTIVVSPVNDPPEVRATRVHRRSGSRGPMHVQGIAIDDVDAAEAEIMTVDVTVDQGVVSFEESPDVYVQPIYSGKDGRSTGFSVVGLLEDVRQAVRHVWFMPPSEGWEGGAIVRVSAKDGQGATADAEVVMVVSDPDVRPNITIANASFTMDQGMYSSLLRLVYVSDAVAEAASAAGTTPPTFNVVVATEKGRVGLSPIPSGLSLLAGSETAAAASSAVKSGKGLEEIFGTPRSTLSFRGKLQAVNEALRVLMYVSANGTAGLGSDFVTLDVSRRGKHLEFSTHHELKVDVRPVNQPPLVKWPTSPRANELPELGGVSLIGLVVDDSDHPDGGVLNVHLQMFDDADKVVVRSAGEGLEFIRGSAANVPSSVIAFRGSISNISKALSSSAVILANPMLVGILRVEVEDGEGGRSSLDVEIHGNHVNSPPEVMVVKDMEMTLKEGRTLERIGELAGLEIIDSDVDDSPNGYLDVRVRVSHRAVLEVQNITTSATKIDPVQRVSTFSSSERNSTVGGTFNLSLDLSELCDDCKTEIAGPIWHDAVANEGNVYVGVESGGNPGESLQAKLESLDSLRALGITVFCQRDVGLTSTGGREWLVTFLGAPASLPLMQSASNSLTGDSPGLQISSVVKGNSLSGSFTLSLGGFTTENILHSADADDVAAALEALHSITAVDVAKSHSPDAQGGKKWSVTFFDALGSGGDIPLMKGNGQALGGRGATVSVVEAVRGNGIPELWEVATSAAHHNLVSIITLTGALRAKGYFQLALDYDGMHAWTRPIYPQAAGPVSDEDGSWWSFGGIPGRKHGESVEARLESLENWGALGSDAHVVVERVESTDRDTVQWYLSFTGAPEDLSALTARDTQLSGGATVSATVIETHNRVDGSFYLRYGGASTPPLLHDSTGTDIAAALNVLEPLHSRDIGTGYVAATKTQNVTLEGGRRWTIAILRDPETPLNLTATGMSMLTGASARVSARLVRPGGRGAILRLVDLGGAAFGIPGHTVGEQLTIRGSPNMVTNALASLSYSPLPGWSGHADIIFRVNDTGFTGAGGSQSGWAVVPVAVEPVNDVPEVWWCGELLPSDGAMIEGVDEDAPFRLLDYDCLTGGVLERPTAYRHIDFGRPGRGISVRDVDSEASILQARPTAMLSTAHTSAARRSLRTLLRIAFTSAPKKIALLPWSQLSPGAKCPSEL